MIPLKTLAILAIVVAALALAGCVHDGPDPHPVANVTVEELPPGEPPALPSREPGSTQPPAFPDD